MLDWLGGHFRFVLDTIQAVGKALSWVFIKIKVGVDKLINFIGFLFSWNGILTTSDSIKAYLNAGLSYGQSQIGRLKPAIEAYLTTLKENVMKNKSKPPNTAVPSDYHDPDSTDQTKSIMEGVAYNFASYHMQHDVFPLNSTIARKGSCALGASSDTDLSDVWNSISKELDAMRSFAENIATCISDLFTPETNTDQIFERISDQMISIAIETLQNIANMLLSVLDFLISKFRELSDKEIEVPIFGALWKSITNGQPLTLFNCFTLILAIPTTVLYKLFYSNAPPALAGRFTEKTFEQYVTQDPNMDLQLARDYRLVSQCAAVGGMGFAFSIKTINFIAEQVKSAPALEMTGIDGGPKEEPVDLGNPLLDFMLLALDAMDWASYFPFKTAYDKELRYTVSNRHLS